MTIPALLLGSFSSIGQQEFTTAGTFNFVVPQGVFSIAAVCIGGGGSGARGAANIEQSGAGGGGLRWISGMPVIPGETLTVTVGAGGTALNTNAQPGRAGAASSISRGTTVLIQANGGLQSNYSATSVAVGGTGGAGFFDASLIGVAGITTGGGNGGTGGAAGGTNNNSGGGGAGGYGGNGGQGVSASLAFAASPNAGAGGGGAGGLISAATAGTGGGGVGIGLSGTSGSTQGAGGSGGANGSQASGGLYGGGGGGAENSTNGAGGNGAVKIIWGIGRAYPTNVGIVTY